MTDDTRRALQIIEPICSELCISVDADKSKLYIEDDVIGIACNSTYATVMEALGWIFLKQYPRFRHVLIPDMLRKDITRYVISQEQLSKLEQVEETE